MKLEYKIIFLAVLIGILFITAEMISSYISTNPETIDALGPFDILFRPLTMDQGIFINAAILLICFIFGLLLSKLITQVQKEKGVSKQSNIEKNMILDFVPEIVIYMTNEYKIKWGSRSLYDETGLKKIDIVDATIFELGSFVFPAESIEPLYKTFFEKKELTAELKSFKNKYWQIYSNAVRNEKRDVIGYVFLAVDVTKSKTNEEIIRRSYEQLENNIEQFAAVIDNIRNPLSSVVLLAETSEDQNASKIVKKCDDIEEAIAGLDAGWANSEEIRNFLKKHL